MVMRLTDALQTDGFDAMNTKVVREVFEERDLHKRSGGTTHSNSKVLFNQDSQGSQSLYEEAGHRSDETSLRQNCLKLDMWHY